MRGELSKTLDLREARVQVRLYDSKIETEESDVFKREEHSESNSRARSNDRELKMFDFISIQKQLRL